MAASDEASDCVLIVDDDQDIRETMQIILRLDGYCVRTAADGADALAQLRSGVRPRLILLDLMMPRLNGFEFRAEQVADPELCAIPVIALTGAGNADAKAASLGIEGLKKPVPLDTLLATVRRFYPELDAAAHGGAGARV